jgi:hypothetical protein
MIQMRRQYWVAWAARVAAREDFRRSHPARVGRRYIPYPPELKAYPPFSEWLLHEVSLAEDRGEIVPPDVLESSRLPQRRATAYRAMWAHGMHFRVRSSEEQRVTADSGVAATFERHEPNAAEGCVMKTEFVGNVEEILELDYQNHCVVVLLCNWVKANYNRPSPTIIRDDLGFTVANFNNMMELGKESFAFPIHCQQVFFSDDPTREGWKVVCCTDVRGCRGDLRFAPADIKFLAVG